MKTFKRLLAGCMMASLLFAVSCETVVEQIVENPYDDSGLRDEIDGIKDRLDGFQDQIDGIIETIYDLQENMNTEIQALRSLLSGKLMITSVSKDAATGVTTVTLSDGSKLILYPEKNMKSYVTYITLSDGVNYWAYINDEGGKELFLDENGAPVPVMTETPEVIVKDDETWLVIGGKEYPLSGNSVFSDYDLIADELTGEIYAVTFTFGEGMSFTVTVDGASGFFFVKPSGWSTVMISDYYVANGLTERVQLDARGVVDYVLQIPDGWRVKEYEDVFMGARYFDITAPSEELVESGVAAADGDLKVVAVLEGGKATVAKLYLSTSPFKEFGVSLGNADVKMYNGLQKYVYGVCPAAEYDEDAIFAVAEGLLTAYDYPAGYGVADYDIESLPLSEIYGSDLVPGESYVFWAIPALYYVTDTDAGYYLKKGTFVTAEVDYASVKFEVGNESFRDADLSMELKGVGAYYTALVPKVYFLLEDVVYGLNIPGYYEAVNTPLSYEGSVFSFYDVEAEQATEYVAWIAVAEEGKTYTEADVVVCEFSTLNLSAGSSVAVSAADVKATAIDVAVKLEAPGAEAIYYSYLTESNAKKYTDNESRAMYLFENGLSVKAASAQTRLTDVIAKTKPETRYVLMAVASDPDGKYGDVLVYDCATTSIEYNDMVVEISIAKNDPHDVVLNISAEGAEGFVYWVGKTSDNTWKSSNYLGGNAENAQEYIFVNRDQYRITSVMERYPVVDGTISLTDLDMDVDHVIVAMAEDKDGGLSKATEFRFVPRAVAVGNVVYSSDPKWAEATPGVEWLPEKTYAAAGQMSGQFGFTITVPAGFTAYVLSGTESYLNDGDEFLVLTPEEEIVKIIQMVDKKRDSQITIDYDLWEEKGYPYGYEFYHHEHGNPLFGNVVIWASQEFHDSMCGCDGNHMSKLVVNGVEVDVHNEIHINDGKPVEMRQPYAVGSTTEVIDKVFVVCQDLDGNCYEPFRVEVPVDLFLNAGGRDE